MRTPQRKIGKYAHLRPDHHITKEKYHKLQSELDKLKNHIRQPLIKEVKRLALMGDFSENAAYQIAKGRLRGVNQRMVDIENMLKRSTIIKSDRNSNIVKLGTTVVVETNKKQKTFHILGSTETDPNKGIISHNSPIGKALMNKKIGETLFVEINNKKIEYKIIKIK